MARPYNSPIGGDAKLGSMTSNSPRLAASASLADLMQVVQRDEELSCFRGSCPGALAKSVVGKVSESLRGSKSASVTQLAENFEKMMVDDAQRGD